MESNVFKPNFLRNLVNSVLSLVGFLIIYVVVLAIFDYPLTAEGGISLVFKGILIIGALFFILRPFLTAYTITVLKEDVTFKNVLKSQTFNLKEYYLTSTSTSYGYYGTSLITSRKIVASSTKDDSARPVSMKMRGYDRKDFAKIMNLISKTQQNRMPDDIQAQERMVTVVNPADETLDFVVEEKHFTSFSLVFFILLIAITIGAFVVGLNSGDMSIVIAGVVLAVATIGYLLTTRKPSARSIVKAVINKEGVSFSTTKKDFFTPWGEITKIEMTPLGYTGSHERQIFLWRDGQRLEFAFGAENNENLTPYYEDLDAYLRYHGKDKIEYIFH